MKTEKEKSDPERKEVVEETEDTHDSSRSEPKEIEVGWHDPNLND